MVVQFVPSAEVWIWNAVAYAVSQTSVTLQIGWLEPRSTRSHWGSENALDHRVPVFPSVAAEAGNEALWGEDAVVGWLRARLAGPQPPPRSRSWPGLRPAAPRWCRLRAASSTTGRAPRAPAR